jgi:hypothetical protein
MPESFFFTIAILFAVGIIFMLFTREGRDLSIKLTFGAESIEDLGSIGEPKPLGLVGKQKVRLLKCLKKNQTFYLLEITHNYWGSRQLFWVPIDNDMVTQLSSLVK